MNLLQQMPSLKNSGSILENPHKLRRVYNLVYTRMGEKKAIRSALEAIYERWKKILIEDLI